MDTPDGILWRWAAMGLCMSGVLLLCIGLGQEGRAQSPLPDSLQRPPEVERVRQRIEEIRRTSNQWRQRLGKRLAPQAPSPQAPSPSSDRRLDRYRAPETGPTRADLRRVERRLQELISQLLANEYGTEVPARELAERFRFLPPDTVRVETPVPDTVTVADSVRVVRDTVRETRVEIVERRLLDTGVFRGFEVNFAFGESTLQPRATRTLDAVGEVLQRYPELRIEIGGHTDAVGADAFNQRLSEARAEAVRAYLINRFDLSPDRLVARGYGESQPVASNEERSGRALNRRVEFKVLNPGALE